MLAVGARGGGLGRAGLDGRATSATHFLISSCVTACSCSRATNLAVVSERSDVSAALSERSRLSSSCAQKRRRALMVRCSRVRGYGSKSRVQLRV